MMTATDLTPIAIEQILSQDCCLFSAREDSKKKVFELIALLTTKHLPHIDAKHVLEGLMTREKLGSTAIGAGVALPHTRVESLAQPIAAFIHLQQPIVFDSPDEQPVDLFFGILVPTESNSQHLQVLSQLAKFFQQPQNRERCRAAGDNQLLYLTLTQMRDHHAHEPNR